MNLDDSATETAFRNAAREWISAHRPSSEYSIDTPEGFARGREWDRQLFAAGWAQPAWPREYGGRGASLFEWLIFEEEYWRAGAPPRVSQNGLYLLGPALLELGTDEQKRRLLPRIAAADDVWAQGWSEPEAGSDLAALKSRAERDERRGGWRLYGQKTWCSRGAYCDGLFGLFRSDAAAERHRGLTYLLVPLRTDGVTVRAVRRLDGDPGFAEVFFDGAFVPDRDVLGGVGDGWKVAMATAGSERGLTLRSPGRFLATAARLVELYRRRPAPRLRERVAQAAIDAESYRLYTLATATRLSDGASLGAEASLNKIFWSELDVRMHELALELLGADAELDESGWMKGFEFALAGPIYAGTNEIQRNVVAERLLGLPRR
jgi:alkylation response protein AidB-like acyl-CoA dehydrogenase